MRRTAFIVTLLLTSLMITQYASSERLGYIADNQGEIYLLQKEEPFSATRIGTFFPEAPLTRQYINVIGINREKGLLLGFGIASVSQMDINTLQSKQRLCPWLESLASPPKCSIDGSLILADVTYVESMVPSLSKRLQSEPLRRYGLAILASDSLVPLLFLDRVGGNAFFTPDATSIIAQGRNHKVLMYKVSDGGVEDYLTLDEGCFYDIKWAGNDAIAFVEIPVASVGAVTRCLLVRPGISPKILGEYSGRRLPNFSDGKDGREAFYNGETNMLTIATPIAEGSVAKEFVAGLFQNLPPDQREKLKAPVSQDELLVFDGFKRSFDAPWTEGYLLDEGKVLFCDNPGTRQSAHLQLLDSQSGEWSEVITFGTGGATNFAAIAD